MTEQNHMSDVAQPVAWTNEKQLGFLKDPTYALVPMAMWAKRDEKYADIALYASQPPAAPDRQDIAKAIAYDLEEGPAHGARVATTPHLDNYHVNGHVNLLALADAVLRLGQPPAAPVETGLKRRSEADAYFKILQTIARFPITDPKGNMDAVNMRLIAEGALECGAESNRHSGAVGNGERAEQSNPGGEDVTHLTNSQNGSHLQKPPADEPTPPAGLLRSSAATASDALRAIYEWYDRDGSVGGASEVFEQHRAALTAAVPQGARVTDEDADELIAELRLNQRCSLPHSHLCGRAADLIEAQRTAVVTERENCAQIALSRQAQGYVPDAGCFSCFDRIAKAIRQQPSSLSRPQSEGK